VTKDVQPQHAPSPRPLTESTAGDKDVPLCVDLDGTLVNTDYFWEGAAQLLFRHPAQFARIVCGFWRGRAWVKRQLTQCTNLPPDSLPWNADILAWVSRQKAAGRKTILVTAADQSIADAVAAHLKLFDQAIGSDGVTNLKGRAKAALLVEKFGRAGFDYVGDSRADIAVWKAGRRAYLVRPSPALNAWASKRDSATTLTGPRGSLRPLFRALRPQHWVKNTLVFLPLFTAHVWNQADAWWKLAGLFLALCFGASAVYLLNDLADIESDRRHKDKRRRPIASGELPIADAFLAIPLCLLLAVSFCLMAGGKALPLLLGYLAATTAYSFHLKRVPILDILLLSGFYVFRIVAGAVVAPVQLSPWLIAFAMFLFLSLAAAKRYVELTSLSDGSRANVSRGYVREDYAMIAAVGVNCGCLAVLVLGLYVNSDTFRTLYSHATVFWLLCPLLLYWLIRVWLLAGRRELRDDPVVFAITDRVTWIVAALGALVFYVAMTAHFR